MPPACARCSKPLEVEVDAFDDDGDDDDNEDVEMGDAAAGASESQTQTVPDDVLLSCGHHFHWECLLDSYEISKCPHCDDDITSAPAAAQAPQILVDMTNEGGTQHQIDIFPLLQEESYLRAYPEETKCRAFLEFCREGDHRAIAELLKTCSDPSGDDDGPSKSADEVLLYQDPIWDMQSGLHAAAANGHREVAWMLLLLASDLPELEFPALVFQEAATLGVMREDRDGKVDIRSLRDSHGRSAEDVARENGVVWNGWIGKNRLAV